MQISGGIIKLPYAVFQIAWVPAGANGLVLYHYLRYIFLRTVQSRNPGWNDKVISHQGGHREFNRLSCSGIGGD